ncbi:DNA repair exonuclease SbcCD nuclease subunit [Salinibacter ruber]|uniref:metallophosphoesterase family protein n=1 Tax=Salinibacter ruber TaxID=146919 RepID=UPI00216A2C40|nr:DNA repair exonuclease SbcCD nuclease subunit [Salinibacter ruber]
MVRILHTADLQIGKPFNWASGRARSKLREAREDVIGRIGDVAGEHEVDFLLIAGDLFDDNTVADDVVSRTCERLSGISVPVYILPGNHDFAGSPSCVYQRDPFRSRKPNHVHVLDRPQPTGVEADAGEDVIILPAPVRRRNERGDPTSHITSDFGREEAPEALRVGLAHGGVEAFGAGDAASRIDPGRAEEAELDYLALGDWHGTMQAGPRTWYSGAPEPDSFTQNDPGNVLVVEIESEEEPSIEKVPTGTHKWLRKEETLRSREDVEALRRWFEGLEDPLSVLVRLELSGTLGMEAARKLDKVKERLEDIVLKVRHRGEVRPKASEEEIESIASDGYVGDTVESLRAVSEAGGEKADAADRALQLLYQFHEE